MMLIGLPGLGETSVRDLQRMGILLPEDLLEHYPMRYDDFSNRRLVSDVAPGETVTLSGVITSIASRPVPGRRLTIINAIFSDTSGSIRVIWFNQRFLLKTLTPGTHVTLSGQVELQKQGLQLKNPSFEVQRGQETTHTGRIVPIYPLEASLTQKRLRTAIAALLRTERIVDWLPEEIRHREQLIDLPRALQQIHFPETFDAAEEARHRLQFDELFLYELAHLRSREELKKLSAPAIAEAIETIKLFVQSLPFTLTTAQRKAAWQIIEDMSRGEPMNRLLEGDVGSGKTVAAAIAALNAATAGYQTALLAPTEILAEQHATTLQRLLGEEAVILVTRTHGQDRLPEIAKGEAKIIVGTHALLENKVMFHRLGLVIVDEQHRFGVKQRQALKEKQMDDGTVPHLLSMTATPIPRTLALTLYGDLDISVLDEMPKGRKPIKTEIVKKGDSDFTRIKQELDAGRQAFFVCALIDPSEEVEAKSVTELHDELQKGPLKGYRAAVLHGRMKSEEKERIMAEFKQGNLHALISTTVIEVGVDVPNATVMFVEGAERFGLAQLHQLRGRVGRSDLPSLCFLRPSGFVPEQTYERLRALVECNNGFELAERDLALRGPGDIYGTVQSGFPGFKLADLFNAPMIAKARNAAQSLLKEEGGLSRYPAVRARLGEYVKKIHFE
ncbi:MAG: ATP-dependent DNA helicase RecG [Patescibacteria group bacterium]